MVDRIVLDVELADAEPIGKAVAADERRETGVEAGPRLAGDRQQLAITPQVLRPAFDLLARQRDRAVVVNRLERAEALLTHVDCFGKERGLTEMTLQSNQRAHTTSACKRRSTQRPLSTQRSSFSAGSASSAFNVVGPKTAWGTDNTGAGTIAALSRAMAAMSLMIATAVASPPAPAPKMPV